MPIDVALFLAGGIGALVRILIKDNCLELPSIRSGKLYFGFFGVMVIGAFIGYVVDNNTLTAGLAGYVGISTISHLLPKAI